MFGKTQHPPAIKLTQLSSLIDDGVEIEGDLVFGNGLRIDGQVRGHLHGRTGDDGRPALLVLSQTGRIEGSVRCGHALINGCIIGDVEVEQFVELQAGARITGTLRYRQLKMDVGARVLGQLMPNDDEAAPTSAKVIELVPESQLAERR
jgi:cytoskeletal protein CcmA (bactofilin family)